jgi:hypothetical protein
MKSTYLNSIKRTENMSGFAGDEFSEEGGSFFEGMDEDYGNADGEGDYYASGGSAPVAYSNPYIISVENTGTVSATATVFGFNQTLGQTNFGNPTAIRITDVISGTTAGYSLLMGQTVSKPFQIGKWRFESSSSTALLQTLSLQRTDANGFTNSKPLLLSQLKDAYQYQASILESKSTFTIDGNSFFTLLVPAGATITISMYPTVIASVRSEIVTGKLMNRTVPQRTNAKNTPITVINTNENVRSISGK